MVVLLDIQAVHHWKYPEVGGLRSQVHRSSRNDDRLPDLELPELDDLLARDHRVLERPAGGRNLPPIEVPVLLRIAKQPCAFQHPLVGEGHRRVEVARHEDRTTDGDFVRQAARSRRRGRVHQAVVSRRDLKQSHQARILLAHNGLLGEVLRVLHDVAAEVVQVFLLDLGERSDAEQLHLDALALKRGDLNFTLVAVEHVRLTQVVQHVVLDRDTGGEGVFDQHVAQDALIAQLQLDRANHALPQAHHAVLAIREDVSELGLLLPVGELLPAHAVHDPLNLSDVVL